MGERCCSGNWGLYARRCVMMVFNTVLGEELLFRGLLLPRMRAAFGRGDWVANAVLFGAYHLHQPWHIATSIAPACSWPTRRGKWRSAWLGIIIHSTQSVVLAALTLVLVPRGQSIVESAPYRGGGRRFTAAGARGCGRTAEGAARSRAW